MTYTWYLHGFSNVGIKEGWRCPYFKDVEAYDKLFCFSYEDSDMLYAGVALALQGEYDLIYNRIDKSLSLISETKFLLLKDYFDLDTLDLWDIEDYFMLCYACHQAENGEFNKQPEVEVIDYEEVAKKDEINPAHYDFLPGVSVGDICVQLDSYWKGSAFKYLARAGKKKSAPEITDLEKAIRCLQLEIERLEKENVVD